MMGSVIPAIILGVVGFGLCALIGWIVLYPLAGNAFHWMGRQKLLRRQKLLMTADLLLKAGDFGSSLPKLRESFVLEIPPLRAAAVEGVAHHNLSILSRLINIAERSGTHIPNLAIVEDLLATRAQLCRALVETTLGKRSLGKKIGEKKEVPDWALAEYDKKLAEINDRLVPNRKSLEAKLGDIFTSLSSPPSVSEVTYH